MTLPIFILIFCRLKYFDWLVVLKFDRLGLAVVEFEMTGPPVGVHQGQLLLHATWWHQQEKAPSVGVRNE